MAVARYHQLLAVALKGIEGVLELFLRRFLGGEEVEVVQEQRVALAKVLAESAQVAHAHRLDESIRELLCCDETHAPIGPVLAQAHIDSFQQMRFASAYGPVNDKRVGPV